MNLNRSPISIYTISFLTIATILSCKKKDNMTTFSDLVVVTRSTAYEGCFPIVGTSQTGIWDASGTSITASTPDVAFYGQDA